MQFPANVVEDVVDLIVVLEIYSDFLGGLGVLAVDSRFVFFLRFGFSWQRT
jgi:hypothetical protein